MIMNYDFLYIICSENTLFKDIGQNLYNLPLNICIELLL
jgi:hypothetical protein